MSGRRGTAPCGHSGTYVTNSFVTCDSTATPIVKWAGGKTRLLPELLGRRPAEFGRYYEPFCGGGAVFFRIAPDDAVIADTNRDLINLYGVVKDDVESLIIELETYQSSHRASGDDCYYAIRALWNDSDMRWSPLDRAAAFVYLNKTCFNGLWRVNRAGEFNVPVGRYANPAICVPEALRAAHSALARAELRCTDYRETVADAQHGDFVYLDPPYDPVAPTANFTSYTSDAFGREDQRTLAEAARDLVSRGCRVMLSNSDTPFVRSLYQGFRIDQVQCSRAINSCGAKRGKVDELIIMGGYDELVDSLEAVS